MASINYAAREISVKIVYYGPGLSGKTTNLQIIHRKLPAGHRSDMVSLATETDRTLFFDFLPVDLGTIKGFATKFQLYTVPGQVYYNATRKLVLRGVDGIVFVADSATDKVAENIESFRNLEDNLLEYHYRREDIPIIIQYNKRDLPTALAITELQQQINKYNLPFTEAIASKGVGVFDSLKLIGKMVIDGLNQKYSRTARAPAQAAHPAPGVHAPLSTATTTISAAAALLAAPAQSPAAAATPAPVQVMPPPHPAAPAHTTVSAPAPKPPAATVPLKPLPQSPASPTGRPDNQPFATRPQEPVKSRKRGFLAWLFGKR